MTSPGGHDMVVECNERRALKICTCYKKDKILPLGIFLNTVVFIITNIKPYVVMKWNLHFKWQHLKNWQLFTIWSGFFVLARFQSKQYCNNWLPPHNSEVWMYFFYFIQCTRVMWTPPLRESFSYPFLVFQLLAVTVTIKYVNPLPSLIIN